MLRITVSDSEAGAKKYFQEALTRGDYYLDGQEAAGQWGGKGAAMLDLKGGVTKEAFMRLLSNRQPDGSRLTPRDALNRRPGYDFTFDVPKSVSILQAYFTDEAITAALHRAVDETMMEIEQDMHTRVRRDGAFEDRPTGNMIWGTFTHYTSRPAPAMHGLAEGLPDPHLHVHAYCVNATYDPVENRFKAGEFMRIKRDAHYYQAAFHTRLAGELQKLGYEIAPTKHAFEIKGIPATSIKRFSRRTKQIEDFAEEHDIHDPERRGQLGAKLRSGKDKDLTMTELRTAWTQAMEGTEMHELEAAQISAQESPDKDVVIDSHATQDAMSFSLLHELERVSEVGEKRLLGTALQSAIGRTDIATMVGSYSAHPDIIRGAYGDETRVTTLAILEEEQRMIDLALAGRGQFRPLVEEPYQFKEPLLRDPQRDTDEQQRAARHILYSCDWITGVVGKAGAGKTTLLKEIRAGARETGYDMVVVAPTAEASREVLRAEGFHHADTVKRLLADEQMQAGLRDKVLLVDEAGMVGTKDMLALLETARKQGAVKVVLSGDPKQIRSVPRGDALRTLQAFGGVDLAHLGKIQRQRDPALKQAVEAIAEGRVAKGFRLLEDHGGIIAKDSEDRMRALAQSYVETVQEKRGRFQKTALVISPTHREGEQVTRHIREQLKEAGQISGQERTFSRLVPLATTEAERAAPETYQPDMLVRFGQQWGDFKKGQIAAVDMNDQGKAHLRSPGGFLSPLPLKAATHLELYRRDTIRLAAGDKVRVTAGAKLDRGPGLRPLEMARGGTYQIADFDWAGNIVLTNGATLSQDFGHIAHGYCITADSAQAKTVDRVFASIGENSLSATDLRRFYVAISRAREEARVFTHDRQELMEAVMRDAPRRSAIELAGIDRRESFTREQAIRLAHDQYRDRENHRTRERNNRSRERDIDE
ncbi:MobF family relaxase [Cerasicoccus arenae]|uniref:TrwC relaxase domain-containing protein n=1 Tax=Cerasicoccus arenae TaxID=424488 RepID=A0A8J3GD61_9BACT|nr:MobF family relaxase [Cerasicoccus arenae]MBK1859367.1 relaxase domain-containing protein [Cerasicoccus arenae]GHB93304.1 hypothetical protein GCM10007047_05820 [Cerasicoccus arenae]